MMVIHLFYFGMYNNLVDTTMEQDKINLLIEDLSARLPYGVFVDFNGIIGTLHNVYVYHFYDSFDKINRLEGEVDIFGDAHLISINNVKPFLLPLSSITEEQYNELKHLHYFDNCAHSCTFGKTFRIEYIKTFSKPLLKWFLEHHIDINGLIPLGLAIDATNLDIY